MLADATTLHPRLRDDPREIETLRARWLQTRRLRIDDALAPGLAAAFADAALGLPFQFFEKHANEIRCVFWRQTHPYPAVSGGASSFAPMAQAWQLFKRDLPALATAITHQALQSTDSAEVVLDCYSKGSYLDAHTDQGADRLIAYVVGLTRDAWPAERGGHLEFLQPDEQTVIERVAPGFGSIDLFCIYPLLQAHRVPLLRDPVVRLSVNGWLTGELKGPRED